MSIDRRVASIAFVLLVLGAPPLGADEFDEWNEQQSQAFEDWRAEQDRAFREMLERQWRAFERFEARQRDDEPKPPRQPRVTSSVERNSEPLPEPGAQPAEPAAAHFLGHALRPPAWDTSSIGHVQPEPDAVAALFGDLLQTRYKPLVDWLRSRSDRWRLGDWGRMQLVRTVVAEHDIDSHLRPLLSWFLLLRLNQDVRVGHADGTFILLTAARQDVYEKSYFRIGGKIYYAMFDSVKGARLFSYAGQHAAAEVPDFAPRRHPRTNAEKATAMLKAGNHRMPLDYDLRLARYYRDYPQLDLDHFLAAPLDPVLARSASRYWREKGLGDRPPIEQVNLLLSMVQRLPYETDQEQFGVEKYMLSGEIFTHPASDCDDRTLLFTALVEHLVGVDTVNLVYPGHVATAVAIEGEGDRWKIAGASYLVADPTYVGASAGMTMSRYQGRQPEVVGL